jgi:hypothetical protein
MLTKVPAKATINSSDGFSGNRSSLANPPMGKRVMSLVFML